MKYVNTDASRRVWPNIQLPDGSTLELDPGEEIEIKGKQIKDPILKRTKLTKKEQEAQDKKDAEEAEAAAAAAGDDSANKADVEEQK